MQLRPSRIQPLWNQISRSTCRSPLMAMRFRGFCSSYSSQQRLYSSPAVQRPAYSVENEMSDVESHRIDRADEHVFTSSYSLRASSIGQPLSILEIYRKFFQKGQAPLPPQFPPIQVNSHFAIIPLESDSSNVQDIPRKEHLSENDSFLILYNFGAVVLFNVDNIADYPSLTEFFNSVNVPIDTFSRNSELNMKNMTFVEDYGIAVDSNYNVLEHGRYAEAYAEKIILRKLDLESLKIISHILAHSAGLHLTRALLNRFIDKFEDHLLALDKEDNDTMIASWIKRWGVNENLVVNIQELTKVQLSFFKQQKAHEWSDAAWYHEEYDEVRVAMLDEFSMKTRMNDLQTKLDYMTLNFKTFFEISASKEGAASERAIVLFFFIELWLTVYEIYHLS